MVCFLIKFENWLYRAYLPHLITLDGAKAHNFRIFVKNKVGTSEPLILEDVKIPLNHLGLAIEEVFDDNTTNNLGDDTFKIYYLLRR
jgi:hypothetical protein